MADDLESPEQIWKVLIVEDDPILRNHLRSAVTGDAAFDLIGAAETVSQARELVGGAPDIVLLDLGLPDGSGIEIINQLRAAGSAAKILVITVFEDRASVVKTLKAGADGYILKDTPSAAVVTFLKATLNGETPISARAAGHLLSLVRDEPPVAASNAPQLAPREKEVLELLARGLNRKEAARVMGISPFTVAEYVQSIYRKMAVRSRGEAVFEAIQAGMIKIDTA